MPILCQSAPDPPYSGRENHCLRGDGSGPTKKRAIRLLSRLSAVGRRPPRQNADPRERTPKTIHLAGIPIRDQAVLELAPLVDDPDLGAKLESAYSRGARILALEIHEHETILAALDDPPAGVAELRGVLLRELTTLRSEGIV